MELKLEEITNKIMEELKGKDVALIVDGDVNRICKKEEKDFIKSMLIDLCYLEDGRAAIHVYNKEDNLYQEINSSVESVLEFNNLIFELFSGKDDRMYIVYKDKAQSDEHSIRIQEKMARYGIIEERGNKKGLNKLHSSKIEFFKDSENIDINEETLSQLDYIYTEFPDNYLKVIPLHFRLKRAVNEEDFEYAARLKNKIEEITASSCPLDNL